jgi:hypothetical protein
VTALGMSSSKVRGLGFKELLQVLQDLHICNRCPCSKANRRQHSHDESFNDDASRRLETRLSLPRFREGNRNRDERVVLDRAW